MVFKDAAKSLRRLESNLSGALFESSSVGNVIMFTVLERSDHVIQDAKPILEGAYIALGQYRQEMEQVQVQHPGLVVTYPQYLGDALREVAAIDLEGLRAGATTVDFDTVAFRAISEAVERARYYESHGDI